MIQRVSNENTEPFPRHESFADCRGVEREFIIDFNRSDDRRFLRAVEVADGEGRYVFEAMSETDPYLALGRLRQTIRRGLSIRYHHRHNGRLELLHDAIEARIGDGGISIDGEWVSFSDLVELIQTYESFRLSLEITDPTDPRSCR
jgi:hypothetical protein